MEKIQIVLAELENLDDKDMEIPSFQVTSDDTIYYFLIPSVVNSLG